MIKSDPTNPWYDYMAKKADTGVSWGFFFNYAKKNSDGTPDTDWNKAAANENFRQCFYYGMDLYNYLATVDPLDPESSARGTMTAYGLSKLSDGTDYTDLVYDAIDYHPTENYSHQDLDKLKDYKEKAMENWPPRRHVPDSYGYLVRSHPVQLGYLHHPQGNHGRCPRHGLY